MKDVPLSPTQDAWEELSNYLAEWGIDHSARYAFDQLRKAGSAQHAMSQHQVQAVRDLVSSAVLATKMNFKDAIEAIGKSLAQAQDVLRTK